MIRLTSKDPQRQKNVVRFSHSMGEFADVRLSEFMIDHLELESTSILRDSEEGQAQLEKERMLRGTSKTKKVSTIPEKEKENEGEDEKEKIDEEEDLEQEKKKKKKGKGKKGASKKAEGKTKAKGKDKKGGKGKKGDSSQFDDEEEARMFALIIYFVNISIFPSLATIQIKSVPGARKASDKPVPQS